MTWIVVVVAVVVLQQQQQRASHLPTQTAYLDSFFSCTCHGITAKQTITTARAVVKQQLSLLSLLILQHPTSTYFSILQWHVTITAKYNK